MQYKRGIFIAAPPERVFQAITDPNQATNGGGSRACTGSRSGKADLRPGGKWSSAGVGADGTSFRVDGEYLEIDPPRLLVHTWVASWTGTLKTMVRWELEPREIHGLQHIGPRKMGMGTMLRLRHEGFAGAPKAALDHVQGWVRVLGWMQAFVERGETIDTRILPGVS